MLNGLRITLTVLLIICSLLLIPLVLLHKGRGGGLADMFGGGITSNLGSSGVAERNLNRITVITGAVWGLAVVLLNFLSTAE